MSELGSEKASGYFNYTLCALQSTKEVCIHCGILSTSLINSWLAEKNPKGRWKKIGTPKASEDIFWGLICQGLMCSENAAAVR